MTQIHNQLRRGVLTEALTKAVGASVGSAGVERFGETLTPTMNLWQLPEWLYLRNEWYFADRTSVGAQAGETSISAIVNPNPDAQGRGWIVVVEAVTARAQSGTTCALWLEQLLRADIASTLTQGNNVNIRDNRFQKNPAIAIQATVVESWTGTDTNTTGLNDIQEEAFNATTTYVEFKTPPYILRPGTGLLVQGSAVNTAIAVNFAGRVRRALPGEL